jgi:hypothetical protein
MLLVTVALKSLRDSSCSTNFLHARRPAGAKSLRADQK